MSTITINSLDKDEDGYYAYFPAGTHLQKYYVGVDYGGNMFGDGRQPEVVIIDLTLWNKDEVMIVNHARVIVGKGLQVEPSVDLKTWMLLENRVDPDDIEKYHVEQTVVARW